MDKGLQKSPSLHERVQGGMKQQYDRTSLKMVKEKADKLITQQMERNMTSKQYDYTMDEPVEETNQMPPLEKMTREELIEYI